MEDKILIIELKKTLKQIEEHKWQINIIEQRIKLLESKKNDLIEKLIEKENEE